MPNRKEGDTAPTGDVGNLARQSLGLDLWLDSCELYVHYGSVHTTRKCPVGKGVSMGTRVQTVGPWSLGHAAGPALWAPRVDGSVQTYSPENEKHPADRVTGMKETKPKEGGWW